MAEAQQEVSGGAAAPLCANGCGFFGSAATKNFCSKCYKEHLIKTADAAAPAVVDEKKMEATAAVAGMATATPVAQTPPPPTTEKENGGGPVETEKHEASGGGGAIECANACGFFGSAATKNMCSGCYRDFLKNAHAAPAVAADKVVLAAAEQPAAAAQISDATSSAAPAVNAAPAAKAANRCASCRKKVGLLGFPCRCGGTFCSVHRYAEKHACDFDFKTADREKIAKDNPLVVAAKLDKI